MSIEEAFFKKAIIRRWRHVKRGTVYLEVGRAELQSAAPISEPTTFVLYLSEDGTIWARPVSEFMDGRFDLMVGKS